MISGKSSVAVGNRLPAFWQTLVLQIATHAPRARCESLPDGIACGDRSARLPIDDERARREMEQVSFF